MAVLSADLLAGARATFGSRARRSARSVSVVSSAGAALIAVSILCWFIAWQLGWQEFAAIAAVGSCTLVLASIFLVGASSLNTTLTLSSQRVRVGETAWVEVSTASRSNRGFIPIQLEVSISDAANGEELKPHRLDLPRLRSGTSHTVILDHEATSRGVFRVGPVRSVRGDPLGLLRRVVRLTAAETLYVHPTTVDLEPLASGMMRDVEGQASPDVSPSDVVFHTLREYVPGDDRKHIDWRASAKLQSTSGDISKFMVRQFVDTRRNHLGVVLSANGDDYLGDDSFEMAVSASASLAARMISLGSHVEVDAAGSSITTETDQSALDGLAAIRRPHRKIALQTQVGEMLFRCPRLSQLAVISGEGVSVADIRTATWGIATSTRKVVIICSPGAASTFNVLEGITVLTLGLLDDLPRLMWLVGKAT